MTAELDHNGLCARSPFCFRRDGHDGLCLDEDPCETPGCGLPLGHDWPCVMDQEPEDDDED